MSPGTTQLLGAAATLYGLGGALSVLLQARRMHVRGTSGDVSSASSPSTSGASRLAALRPGHRRRPVIVVHAVGLVCGTVTLAVALRLRVPVRRMPRPRLWRGRGRGGLRDGRGVGLAYSEL
jgi:hypothetical protein